ncbi:MAG: Bax inhibitor-1/YccA family protein [Deferribacteres bacterium]|nr:Bax inhibitor-1/YccA family protein [candidate division KSB1 bacterium]MCB9502709.1 Bax inhibitor-1/YccA family protein [Deferribacteres bacterium]
MRGSNPLFNSQRFGTRAHVVDESAVMTIQGTMNKTIIMLFLTFLAATFTWEQYFSGNQSSGLLMLGVFGGLIAAMATIFKPNWSPISAPVYAILEGLFLGGISALYAHMYQGIVMQAVGLTFGVMFVMLFLYRSGTIKVTEKLRSGIIAATGAIALFYFVSIILSFFGIGMPLLHSNGLFGIGFSLVVVGVAAFNLLLDFDFIEHASREGMPKYMEWYAGFGLMVTLIWLYLEILRLLAKLQSRD